MQLSEYKKKRNFKKTPEPKGKKISNKGRSFVIQEHHARRLHYDFRLEMDGVLKSWAVPKGPSLDPSQKRLAVEVEDHPLEYGKFEGSIPKGNYGAGEVILWDRGEWVPLIDPKKGLKKGHLEFELNGEKLKGRWHLVRMHTKDRKPNWLLVKEDDSVATTKFDVIKKMPGSVNEKISKQVGKKLKKKLKSNLEIDDIELQLAKLESKPPVGDKWVHEIKYDGYRTLCQIKNKKINLFTRTGLDWTKKYSSVLKELKKIKVGSVWLDGEIVSLDEKGRSDFSLLQESLKKNNGNLVYFIFDILELNGEDLRDLPLIERKEILKKLFSKINSKTILYSDHFSTPGGPTLLASCKLGLEGLVSKDKTQPYMGGRGGAWIKAKCKNGQEFVIGGYTQSDSRHFRSLLLGVYENDELVYVGKVGTGFNSQNTPDLLKKFKNLKASRSPFMKKTFEKNVHWLKPELIAEVEFRGWTRDRILRQAAFKALRLDKPTEEVVMESKNKTKIHKNAIVNISNPEKILIPEGKVTKKNIADYYTATEKYILPHIADRPLSLLRCPDGIKKECFFQKTIPDKKDDPLYEYPIHYKDSSTKSVIHIDNLAGLMALTQLGVLEIHNWGTHIDHYKNPDMIVFDLDPGPNVTLSEVRKGALYLKEILDQLDLKSFLKVSGGKGYHIHIPIEPVYTWDNVKLFAKTVAQQMTETKPTKYLANMSKAKRNRKIFIDYLRNGFGATSIAPYSLRARENGPIALPIDWKDINKIKPDQFTIKNAVAYLKKRKDPWAKYFSIKQKIKILK